MSYKVPFCPWVRTSLSSEGEEEGVTAGFQSPQVGGSSAAVLMGTLGEPHPLLSGSVRETNRTQWGWTGSQETHVLACN